MNKPLAFATGMVVMALLTGCGVHYVRDKHDELSSVPTTTAPWRSLSSGVDVHWWFSCDNQSYNNEAPRCRSMDMVLTRSGELPDWQKIVRTRRSHGSFFELVSIMPVLSAHRDTPHRVLGMSTNKMGLSEFYILRIGADAIAGIDKIGSNNTLFKMDVWHNARCTNENGPLPRLVVEDERSLWVFAEPEPGCGTGRADLRAPIDMMAFDHPELYPDLLERKMLLFYLEWADADQADFLLPRMASSDLRLLANLPRRVIDIAKVPAPTGKLFTLEDGRILTPLPGTPVANVKCSYTTVNSGWAFFVNNTKTWLNGCKQYAATGKGAFP